MSDCKNLERTRQIIRYRATATLLATANKAIHSLKIGGLQNQPTGTLYNFDKV